MENSKLLTILVEIDEGTKTPIKAYNEILSAKYAKAEAAADAAELEAAKAEATELWDKHKAAKKK